jgi:flavorubredoxin
MLLPFCSGTRKLIFHLKEQIQEQGKLATLSEHATLLFTGEETGRLFAELLSKDLNDEEKKMLNYHSRIIQRLKSLHRSCKENE